MLLIATALPIEARPLIEYYQLKKDRSSRTYQVFRNENILAVITGVGKVNSAVGVSYALTRYSLTGQEHILNWGICGTGGKEYEIGNAYLIHKIIDHETQRCFYPDILLTHPFDEADIETFSVPVTSTEVLSADFCDMECSGFYQAASKYVSPHQIHVVKIVSDQLEGQRLKQDFVFRLLQGRMQQLNDYIHTIFESLPPRKEVLDSDEIFLIFHVIEVLRLSESQKHQLLKACKQYKIRTEQGLEFLKKYQKVKVKTKDEGKKHLQQLLMQLSQ